MPISQLAIWPEKTIIRRPAADCPIDMLEAMRLDAPARFKDAYFPQVRVFGRDATEIAPHAADEVRDLGLGKPGKGAADVVPSMLGNAEKGANAARQRAADGGSAVERQKLEHAEKKRRSPGLQTIGEPGFPNGKVRPGWLHCVGPIAQRACQAQRTLWGRTQPAVDTRTMSITIVIRRARPVDARCNSSGSAAKAFANSGSS